MRSPLSALLLLVLTLLPLGALSHAAPSLPVSTAASAERAETIARTHLQENAATYGVAAEDLAELHLQTYRTDRITGAQYLVFIQTVHGLPLHNAIVNVTLDQAGQVMAVGSRAEADVVKRASTDLPTLTAVDAIEAAAEALALPYTPALVTLTETKGGIAQETIFSGGDLSLEAIPVRLMYQSGADGRLQLAWDLNIYQQDAQHWWSVRIDTQTGKMLDVADWVVHDEWIPDEPPAAEHGLLVGGLMGWTKAASLLGTANATNGTLLPRVDVPLSTTEMMTGTYRVFPIPIESPSHASPPAPADGRSLVANPDNTTASPFGWHDTNGVVGAEFTTTQGNNVHTYTDTDANQTPDAGSSPDGGPGLIFDFPLDFTQPPSTYRPAAVTHYFYWTNLMHDIPYIYGFDEAAGNFQENNYGNGGLGSDYVYAESQDGSGSNGGNFLTPPDGMNPRMQMFIWTFTTPPRDGVFDNGVLAHEYGHGISNRLTGGPSNVSCLNNPEAMGEGWSDWQALALMMRIGDTATQGRGVGTYLLGQPPTGAGIRPAPYTTDFAVNDYTYADLPANSGGHGVGFIWATMLWEMNWELISAHGFNPDIYGAPSSGGNNLAYKLVQDGMAIQPCSPGFVDGRNAILAADMILTSGDNQCRIWAAFARRGLGFSASQGSSNSTTDGTAAFDLPPQCASGATPTPTPSQVPPTVTQTPSTLPATFTPTATSVVPTFTPTTVPATVTPTVTQGASTFTPTATQPALTATATSTSVAASATPSVTQIPGTMTATATVGAFTPTPTSSATVEPPTRVLFLPLIRKDE